MSGVCIPRSCPARVPYTQVTTTDCVSSSRAECHLYLIRNTSVPAFALLPCDFSSSAQAVLYLDIRDDWDFDALSREAATTSTASSSRGADCDRLVGPVHATLYSDVDKRDDRNPDVLWIFLVTRRDLTSFTPTLRVRWTTSALYRSIISPLLCSANRVPPFCLWTMQYQFSFLVDDDGKVSMLPTMPLPATPTHTRSHHAKRALSIPHASAIAAPASSNADSGRLHSLTVFVVRKPTTVPVKAAKEEIDENFPSRNVPNTLDVIDPQSLGPLILDGRQRTSTLALSISLATASSPLPDLHRLSEDIFLK
ncbi:hypothetical protein ARMGADRAFT_1092262 [Armillaria gallica]|uniref:Uncharacterized protein n=1 Tax=Armillaria gallica TaxID=47427 RepID=A0A2H3CYJ8_ARMGA|nr:hypothetical protein ARMGADRAFT_1092262 [Armillaria gallica]